jgi:hypothetical protein
VALGYQTFVTSVRLDSAGAVPFAGVGRVVSTQVRVVTPTATPAPASPASSTGAVLPASVGELFDFEQPAVPTASTRREKRARFIRTLQE